jgi:site-specific DNA-methyltransferase (adenine-specific)
MRGMEEASFDALITDPPYSSFGFGKSTAQKYVNKKRSEMPDFIESASIEEWRETTKNWLTQGRRVCKDGAPLLVFCDWRQYPELKEIVAATGWTVRGLPVWDKINGRPQLGRFRQDAELILFASNGKLPVNRNSGFPTHVNRGVLRYMVPNGKYRNHQTEKPLALMRKLVRVTTPGGRILDPFVGSGTTVVAALMEGYQAVGIEITDAYYEIARRRVAEARSM